MGIANFLGFGGKTIYYPGCLTKGILTEEMEQYKEIFNHLGIDFVMLPNDEVCCGLPVRNAGYKKDVKKLAQKNFELFQKKGITKIITSCPSCFHTFEHVYPTQVTGWNIEVEHATVSILKALKKKGIRYKGMESEREIVSYHDPCHLGRYSGIYDEPREVIELLGGKIAEMKNNKKNAMCCGAGAGLRANFPKIAKDIAKKRASQMPKESRKLISPCGLCHANLRSGTEKSCEFSTFVLNKLKEIGK